MKHEFTKEELKNFWSFLVETFEFTDEQTACIDHQAPMTQEMFDSILDRCEELGEVTDPLFSRMLDEYQDFASVRADKIEEEISEVDFPVLTPEESERMREELYAKIRAKYGEDVI